MKKNNTQVWWVLLWLLATSTHAQKHDYNWVMGMHEYPGVTGYNNVILHFTSTGIQVEETDLKMNFESTASAMSDSAGHLLFYTNGCEIANALGEPIQGGSGLNPGEIHDWVCNQTGYISPRGTMTIPVPGSNHTYYLLHMGARYDPVRKVTYGPFYFSIIDMSQNSGKGAVISKNNLLTDGDLEAFTAVRHGNGRDWWVVIPVYGGQEFRLFLVTQNGIEGPFVQNIGPMMNCRRLGSSTFSLDGQKFARAQNCQVIVMDFDRCLGVFSNPQLLDLPDNVIGGGGVAFSPDNHQLLASTQLQILEADLTVPTPVLDSAFLWDYQWGISLQHMQYTPFGQILMNHMHRTKYLSVIGKPSMPGDAMEFEPQGLSLPIFSVRTLPNYPNYRLYDVPGSVCDTLGINAPMVSSTGPELSNEKNIQIFPNPTTGIIQWSGLANTESLTLRVQDALGQVCFEQGNLGASVDLSGLPNGVYFLTLLGAQGQIVTAKAVVLAN